MDPMTRILSVLTRSTNELADHDDAVLADLDQLARQALLNFELASLFDDASELDVARRELVASVLRLSSLLDSWSHSALARRAA
jgi:hypothetical protein